MQKGCDKRNLNFNSSSKHKKIDVCCTQETYLNNMHRFSIRGYEIHRVNGAGRPKGGVLTLVKTSIPSTEVQRSEKADTEYITVKLIPPDRNLTICNLYSLPNKAINLQILQPNSEDWMIVGDFNSHSPSWGYPSINAKGEEVEHWIVSSCLVFINTPTDPPTFYSKVWKTTSTPDIAIATDNIQKTAKREVSEQLGGSDHKPVILTLAKQVNTSAGKMPPSWNYKKADWKRFRELTDIYTKLITFSKHSVSKNAFNFNSAVLKATKESIPRGRWHDYKPYWNSTLEKIHKELSEAREEMGEKPNSTECEKTLPAEGWSRQRKTDTNPGKLENKNSIPQHGERLPKTLAADKVAEWRQLRAGQNNTANHKWSCHRKGGSKRPCQSFWRREHSFTLSWQSQRCPDPDTGCAAKLSYC